jgi:agmatine deiminase
MMPYQTRRQHLMSLAAVGGLAAWGETQSMATTPFHVPDEAEPHERTFMQWPVNMRVHGDPVFLGILQRSIADIANTIAEFEPVVMLMDGRLEARARRMLSGVVEVWDVPTDDLWARDSGPLFVRNEAGALAVRHMNFNGWGGKQDHRNDGPGGPACGGKVGAAFARQWPCGRTWRGGDRRAWHADRP